MIPAIVCLLHLTMKSANAQPARVESDPIRVETPRPEPGKAQLVPAPLVTVPEPNSIAIVTLGLGVLWHARRAKNSERLSAPPGD
ncbi:MAG: PEP-CTERM sorting domain-containing protein [Verrucomicrobiae bacterium]|nr:PEP-CTERM sorting domain-containing protein [Verrucomicrobiae bacterium]